MKSMNFFCKTIGKNFLKMWSTKAFKRLYSFKYLFNKNLYNKNIEFLLGNFF